MRDALGGVVVNPPPTPPTGTLTVNPTSLPYGGGSVTVAWTSNNATGASLDGTTVAVSGFVTSTITASKTFSLVLTGPGGNVTVTAPVSVSTTPPVVNPPTGTLSANPVNLPYGGGNVTLTWTSQNATSAAFGANPVPLNGSKVNAVTASGNFVLTLVGAGGTTTYTVAVVVASAPPPPTPKTYTFTSITYADGSVVVPDGALGLIISKNSLTGKVTVKYLQPN
jgi:hypothetical protein